MATIVASIKTWVYSIGIPKKVCWNPSIFKSFESKMEDMEDMGVDAPCVRSRWVVQLRTFTRTNKKPEVEWDREVQIIPVIWDGITCVRGFHPHPEPMLFYSQSMTYAPRNTEEIKDKPQTPIKFKRKHVLKTDRFEPFGELKPPQKLNSGAVWCLC